MHESADLQIFAQSLRHLVSGITHHNCQFLLPTEVKMTNYVTKNDFKSIVTSIMNDNNASQAKLCELVRDLSSDIKSAVAISNRLMNELEYQAKRSNDLERLLLLSEEKFSVLERRMDHLEINNPHLNTRQIGNCQNACPENPSHAMAEPPNDPCEILLSGISHKVTLSPTEIINRMLLLTGLSSAINHVFSTRDWMHKHKKGSVVRDFVVQFSSPIIRNEVLRRFRYFKNFNNHSIFGDNFSGKIYITDLLPKHSYLLLVKARKMYKSLNYVPPITKNGIVYMRKTSQSPLQPIFTEKDLLNLPINSKLSQTC